MKKWLVLIIAIASIYWFAKRYAGPDETTVEIAENLKGKIDKSERVARQAKVRAIKGSVQSFRVGEGRLPESLQELKKMNYIGSVPPTLSYDPETGQVGE
jgi:hypothetical protein